MKYSQAVLVTCIGSAALVAALPTSQATTLESGAIKPTSAIPVVPKPTPTAKVPVANLKHTIQESNGQQQIVKVTPGARVRPKVHKGKKTRYVPSAHPVQTSGASPSATVIKSRELKVASAETTGQSGSIKSGKGKKKRAKGRFPKKHRKQSKAQPSPTTPTDAATVRDLEARFFFKDFRQKYREAKAERLQKQADAAALKAGMGTREFDEEDLSAREYFDDDLEAREYLEDIDARSIRDAWRAWRKKEEPQVNPAPSTGTSTAREVFEDEIEARDNLEFLAARDLIDVEDIEARNIKDWWNALWNKGTPKQKAERLQRQAKIAQKKADEAAVKAGLKPSTAARGLFDGEELEMREDVEGVDELAARGSNVLDAVVRTFTKNPNQVFDPAPATSIHNKNHPREGDTFDVFDVRDFVEMDQLD